MAAANTQTKAKTPPPADDPKKPSQELVDPSTGELVSVDMSEYAADAGAGFDNQTSEDVGIPALTLLQPLSPVVTADTNDGSIKPGMWFLGGANVVFGSAGPNFVPVITRHVFREWPSKDPSGEAPIADHDITSELIQRVRREQPFGDYVNPNAIDHPLIETFDVFGLTLLPDGGAVPSVVYFSSTHIRPYKDWMTKARTVLIDLGNGRKINPALFAHVYNFQSQRVEKKPHIWWVPTIGWADPAGAPASRLAPSSDLYQQAKALREAVLNGAVRAAPPQRSAAGDESHGAPASREQEKAPY